MKLIVQPDDGVTSLLAGIDSARKSIEIAIFRFDHADIKQALERAVDRGVSVHALIANTNHGSEKELRKLEMELLPAGIEVSRTADDLLRHHYKFMVVDHRLLYVLTFNFTYLDMDNSRSFGIVTEDEDLVHEASRLFHADIKRQTYKPAHKNFIVSPINARHELSRFIKGAEKQLLIYDPEVSDRPMIGLLRDRARAGVEIRIIGRVIKPSAELDAGRLMRMRFHTRTIIRDRRDAFLGSQSLREAELDRRRELGLIVTDHAAVTSLLRVFDRDWGSLTPADMRSEEEMAAPAAARKAVKALVRQLPLAPVVESALKHAAADIRDLNLIGPEFEHNLADALKEAVEDAVSGIVRRNARTAAARG
jgi:phosphatidylserine/phosphatidylglycerophosphate/cardiolipin synthase-like enzyme